MSLGKNIYRLRTARELSQGDLADALDVSRQSISKWETDGAVPELDKLVKLSGLFGVTLDELVRGAPEAAPIPAAKPSAPAQTEIPSPSETEEPQTDTALTAEKAAEPLTGRKLAGILLLFAGGLIILAFLLLMGPGGLLSALLFALPLLACGVLCLTTRRHTGFWCFWAVYAGVFNYLTFATGRINLNLYTLIWSSLDLLPAAVPHLLLSWAFYLSKIVMIFVTVFHFRKQSFPRTPRHGALLAVSWAVYALVLPLITTFLQAFNFSIGNDPSASMWTLYYFIRALASLMDTLRLCVLAAAVTFSVQAVLAWRRERKNVQKAV